MTLSKLYVFEIGCELCGKENSDIYEIDGNVESTYGSCAETVNLNYILRINLKVGARE